MKIGAVAASRNGFYGSAIATCRRAGFQCAQVNLSAAPTPRNIAEIFEACALENIELAAIGCFGNPLHAQARSPEGVTADDLLALLEYLPERPKGVAPLPVVIWSGSVSGQTAVPHPGNRSPHAVEALAQWTRAALPLLAQKNARLLLKPAHAHVLSDLPLVSAFLAAHDPAAVGVVVDPCSFLAPKNFDKRELLIAQAAELLAPRAGLVHLRDARIEKFSLCVTAPGLGQLGFSGMLKLFARHCPDIPWLVDGVDNELQLRRSLEYIRLHACLAGMGS
jgi:sugar phosphate isomerase/epimerase